MFDLIEKTRTVAEIKFLENFHSDRYLFRILNSTRVGNCAANGILRDEEGIPYAIKCNCGHHTYHPVVDDKRVEWSPEFLIREKNQSFVKKRIKDLWIKQL